MSQGGFPGMSLNTDLTVNIAVSLFPLLIIITMLMKLYNQIQGENTLVQSQMRVSCNHLSLYHVSFYRSMIFKFPLYEQLNL